MVNLQVAGAVRVCKVHALGEDEDGKPVLEVACQRRASLVPLGECLGCAAFLEMRTAVGALCVACDPATPG